MSAALNACAAAITGFWDIFDRCIGAIEVVEEQVLADEETIEMHKGDGLFVQPHLCSVKEARLEALRQAKRMVRDAELLTQKVLAGQK